MLTNKKRGVHTMKLKYAVALIKGEQEAILGVFNTKEEADALYSALLDIIK